MTHQVDIIEKQGAEVVEEFGGPCRGRTYGPLIKSETEGVAQVLDDMSNPLFAPCNPRGGHLSHLVSVYLT
jgi:hypothetical protein